MSTLPAASTLGMAAVLSAVSSVFSENGNGAGSTFTDSEEEFQSQIGYKGQTSTSGNVWEERNLAQSQVKSPKNPMNHLNLSSPPFRMVP